MEKNHFLKVKLTKISDDYFKGNHPNGIYKGYIKEGYTPKLPTIGERFYVGAFSTSLVIKELNQENIFKTTYSTYKLEILE